MEGRVAEPLLASSFISEGELERLVEGSDEGGARKTGGSADGVRLGIGKELDDGALGGGVRGGNVVGVWGEGGEVCRALLVDSLLKYPGSMAAVVDTTGNFDVVKLYTGILDRMRKAPESVDELRTVTDTKEMGGIEDVAARVLDQVKIMRVFDFVGVREAIGEIRDDLEGRRAKPKKQEAEEKPMVATRPSTPKRPTPEPLTPEPMPKRTVVADSEDEDDEEEMLFDTAKSAEAFSTLPPPNPSPQPEVHQAETLALQEEPQDEDSPSKVRFILIDNLAQVLNPLLKKDYIQANALASTFLQTLNHLTRTHNLHTILANPATSPRPSSPVRHPQNQGPLPPEHAKQQPPQPPSIFASNGLVPSLMGVLARYVDVSLLMSQLPKKKMDAKVYYRDENVGVTKKLRGVEMVSVMEVMSDRWEGRVGAWASL